MSPEAKERKRIRMRAYRKAHPEKARAAVRRAIAKRRDYYNAKRKAQYHANPEPQKARARRYYQQHRQKVLAYQRRANARQQRLRGQARAAMIRQRWQETPVE